MKLRELRLRSDLAVARDNDRVVVHAVEDALHSADHSIDAPSGLAVDERVVAIPPCIPDVQHVGFREMRRKIGVRVRRPEMLEPDGRV